MEPDTQEDHYVTNEECEFLVNDKSIEVTYSGYFSYDTLSYDDSHKIGK